MSGTPIENSLSDLWSQMQFINPDLLGNYTFFKREFIAPIERQQDEVQKERLNNQSGSMTNGSVCVCVFVRARERKKNRNIE